ncbi:hypothetical protein M8C21_004693, partial [Ambrosia artemisiifolia]
MSLMVLCNCRSHSS